VEKFSAGCHSFFPISYRTPYVGMAPKKIAATLKVHK